MIALRLLRACPSIQNFPSDLKTEGALRFCVDTRKYAQPSAFVAIPGQKVNPLDRLEGILDQGCPLVVFQDEGDNQKKVEALRARYPGTRFLSAKDSVTFLQELARAHVLDWKQGGAERRVFAISGSNGKTTHKEMLAFLLKSVMPGKIVATEKNNNNHLGVPLTLLQITEDTELVVLELGSNHPGEIKLLCDIACPDAGITTNIGATHLEFFGSEEAVFEEEAYLFHAVAEVTGGAGFFLINVDDPYLQKLQATPGSITYGVDASAEAVVNFLDQGATLDYRGQRLEVENSNITGKHNKLNLITCCFIACHFFPQHRELFVAHARDFRPTRNRSEWIDFEGRSVFLDAYNANPSSMKAALAGFREHLLDRGHTLSEACVVLGDMNELGEKTPEYHRDVGEFVQELGFTNVFYIGRYAQFYVQGHPEGEVRNSSSEFKQQYRNECLKKYPIHFIKGSRSLQLESLFDIT